LGAEVLGQVLLVDERHSHLYVIDSTDPGQVSRTMSCISLDRALFIVSSKSGTTLEPLLLFDYFLGLVRSRIGVEQAKTRFIFVTDPGSGLESRARLEGFSQIWHGHPDVGGRFSVLSNFGLVPAAAAGVNTSILLNRALTMAASCSYRTSARTNPGVRLGLILGLAASCGRDKVALVLSPEISPLGSWIEQLLAESTGKFGFGLIPVVDEALGALGVYRDDRLFVYLRLETAVDPVQEKALERIGDAGHPVVTLSLSDTMDIGGEFFRWQFATAVCSAVLKINPFDQPDVEASKEAARELTNSYGASVSIRNVPPLAVVDGIKLYADSSNVKFFGSLSRGLSRVEDYLSAHLGRLGDGDYFAILAYIDRNPSNAAILQRLREIVRDSRKVATTVGFGPRFLHSTGQLFKGGPSTGVFLQITCDDALELKIPSLGYSLGVVKAAQALADGRVLDERGRRILMVHVGTDVVSGLTRLEQLVRSALQQSELDDISQGDELA
tara:strand:- start:1197 stop:2693 length:1497 start_codon:yes stop_codon:yes gene_type:complete